MMMKKLLLLCLVVLLALCTISRSSASLVQKKNTALSTVPVREDEEERGGEVPGSPRFLVRRATTVMYDDFSSGHIAPSRWYHSIAARGMHDQFQILSPAHENSYVRNGILFIKPTLTVDKFGDNFLHNGDLNGQALWGGCTESYLPCHLHGNQIPPVMSAMVRSHAHIKYGKVEIVAKLAKGDWLWNALWMMPTKPVHYGGWPRSGEMDILEAAGNRHLIHPGGQSSGIDAAHCTFHFGPSREVDGKKGEVYRLQHGTFGDNFHKYWLDWREDHVTMGVDDHPCVTLPTHSGQSIWQDQHLPGNNIYSHGTKLAPFDQPFFIIMNVAVGGGNFWDGNVNHPYPKPYKFSELGDGTGMHKFWNARHLWEPTWIGEDKALKIRSVKMEQY